MTDKYYIEQGDEMACWFPRAEGTRFDAAITQNEKGGVRCLLLCSMEHAPMIKRALEAQAELEEFSRTFGNVNVYEKGFVDDLFKQPFATVGVVKSKSFIVGDGVVDSGDLFMTFRKAAVAANKATDRYNRTQGNIMHKITENTKTSLFDSSTAVDAEPVDVIKILTLISDGEDAKLNSAGAQQLLEKLNLSDSFKTWLQAISQEARMILGELRAGVVEEVKENISSIAEQAVRPSVLYRPALTFNKGVWKATYGSYVASGSSPEEAMRAFDVMWCKDAEAVKVGEKEISPFDMIYVQRIQYSNICECFDFISGRDKNIVQLPVSYVVNPKWFDKLDKIEHVLSGMPRYQRQELCNKSEREYAKSHPSASRTWKLMGALLCEFADQYEGRE